MRRAIVGIALILCATQAAECCSLRSMELKRVPPDITVRITHDKAPIAGIEVQVVPEKSTDPVFTGATDKYGIVSIRDLASGRYFLSASHLGFEAGREWIEVVDVPDDNTKNYFNFAWESDYQTRRIMGKLTGLVPDNTGNKLMDIARPRETVYGGIAVTLRNAFGTDEYRTASDSNGSFLIDHIPDGIYILTIAGGMKAISGTADVTSRVVDVESSYALPLQLRDTGCYRTEFQLRDN